MKYEAKELLKSLLPDAVLNMIRHQQIKNWRKKGCPAPPPHVVKQTVIAGYQQKSGYTTLIETGTFRGDMIGAQKKRFRQVISIELGTDLYQKAKRRFRNEPHIRIVQGDSSEQLPLLLKDINEPAIFWLDGHYSSGITAKGNKECPVLEELDAIFTNNHYNHIILVDDARSFTGKNDYPTIEQVKQFINDRDPHYKITIENDIICCLPGQFGS